MVDLSRLKLSADRRWDDDCCRSVYRRFNPNSVVILNVFWCVGGHPPIRHRMSAQIGRGLIDTGCAKWESL